MTYQPRHPSLLPLAAHLELEVPRRGHAARVYGFVAFGGAPPFPCEPLFGWHGNITETAICLRLDLIGSGHHHTPLNLPGRRHWGLGSDGALYVLGDEHRSQHKNLIDAERNLVSLLRLG